MCWWQMGGVAMVTLSIAAEAGKLLKSIPFQFSHTVWREITLTRYYSPSLLFGCMLNIVTSYKNFFSCITANWWYNIHKQQTWELKWHWANIKCKYKYKLKHVKDASLRRQRPLHHWHMTCIPAPMCQLQHWINANAAIVCNKFVAVRLLQLLGGVMLFYAAPLWFLKVLPNRIYHKHLWRWPISCPLLHFQHWKWFQINFHKTA